MPYKTNADLPKEISNVLPTEAQSRWREVFNDTMQRHDSEGRAMATAWRVVGQGWKKGTAGRWVRKADESFTPPEAVRNAARRGLELREKYGRGGLTTQEAGAQGIGSGVARARDLAAGKAVSEQTIRRMVAFFARHEKNKDSKMPNGEPGAGYVAWRLWGGDPGRGWATTIRDRLDREEVGKTAEEAWRHDVTIAKVDMERHLVFGWANVAVRKDGEQIVDRQDDVMDMADLEPAAYQFNLDFRKTGEMHKGGAKGDLIESFVVTPEKLAKMGLAQDALPQGWWVGFFVPDDAVMKRVHDGTYKMFSIQGRALREEVK